MRSEWQKTKETIHGYPAIKNRITRELCLAGKKGEIWVKNDSTLSMVLVYNKIDSSPKKGSKSGGLSQNYREVVIHFRPEKLPWALKRIGYTTQQKRQINYANSF